jgi:ornithine--oxo-acid transaminase
VYGTRRGQQLHSKVIAMLPAELIALEDRYGAHNYAPLDVVIERASGAWVYDTEGRRYLDFLAAYSAVNQGHCHPAIFAAMVGQAEKVTLTSRAFRNDQLPLLYRDLHELTGYAMMLPMNSGAEAVETALKAARKWGEVVKGIAEGKAEIVVARQQLSWADDDCGDFRRMRSIAMASGRFTAGFQDHSFRRH